MPPAEVTDWTPQATGKHSRNSTARREGPWPCTSSLSYEGSLPARRWARASELCEPMRPQGSGASKECITLAEAAAVWRRTAETTRIPSGGGAGVHGCGASRHRPGPGGPSSQGTHLPIHDPNRWAVIIDGEGRKRYPSTHAGTT
jgi:hypothetical protein